MSAAALVMALAFSCGGQAPAPESMVGAGAGARSGGQAQAGAGSAPKERRRAQVAGVELLVELPAERASQGEVDALLVFHGTVGPGGPTVAAAERALEEFGRLLDRRDLLLVSVAYGEEGLFGDNLGEAEAALDWLQGPAGAELGVPVGRIFLAGHSQGGYLVMRLNALHEVAGVIASAPGPLDLALRCSLEDEGRAPKSVPCQRLRAAHGSPAEAPEAYAARSLLAHAGGQRSPLLVVQGMADSPIQLRSWPALRRELEKGGAGAKTAVLELEGLGHPALFQSEEARRAFNAALR